MYKNKLQELCQRRSWELPEYTTVKDGPDHMPAFKAYVKVHGEAFETPEQCKSAKDAQNTVARMAFHHFYVPPPPPRVTRPLTPAAAAARGVNSVFGPVTVASPLPAVSPDVSIAFNHFNVPPPQPRVTRPLTPTSAPSVAAAPPVNSVFGGFTLASPLPAVRPAASLPAVSSDVLIARVSPAANPSAMQSVAEVTPVIPVSPPPSSLPIPPPGLLSTKNDANTKPSNGDIMPQTCEDTTENSVIYRIAIGTQDKSYKDTLHMYKNRLQQYAQKQNLGFPVYSCEAEGPPHDRRFKSRVSFDGKSYETVEFFPTLKEAEQAAAKVACHVLSADDGGLYKNLLQEFAQKKGLLCPTYETVSSGLSHRPSFVSTVEIGSGTFRGDEAKTKKQAEMNAAKIAYMALQERFSAKESSSVSSVTVADNLALNIQPTATPKKHQDATGEEDQIHIKRAKSSSEDISVDSSSNDSNLLSSQVENSTPAGPVTEKPVRTKTVVFPRKLNLPIPEGATVMPYSDDKWVAYKIELK
ncbi:hypothetical protein BUALT_Bualt09G0061900 [Buddleja alternifolia]|uniref:DRBM domain-containing protein n=1 Tax=Buddleja alternifolia TaxID=168488 RepID=A0AAV6X1L4_9LAMI|nr:hypothetical protein BUALT_Bualt09G0061900 [Buddleja alternifolia]